MFSEKNHIFFGRKKESLSSRFRWLERSRGKNDQKKSRTGGVEAKRGCMKIKGHARKA